MKLFQAEYEHKYKNMLIEREERNKVEEVPPSVVSVSIGDLVPLLKH